MPVVKGSPFRIDWKDKEAVIAYAMKLGKGNVVLKYPKRDNYNITHASRVGISELNYVVFTS